MDIQDSNYFTIKLSGEIFAADVENLHIHQTTGKAIYSEIDMNSVLRINAITSVEMVDSHFDNIIIQEALII